ncbi:uncharacterized protein THITE_127241 [Thermothielavioides terrestris NRRL 8126]|uniref:Uncharacterized protein n=1 Tax=Thermothielavioides terrestris (strain ATCC 38088 / NRRL 8126) TaxID=578455 RepID=G2RDD6_THETT|nr:uncharacterized protein THITE_127241 [Thermothielavioides terrestris NRRL 8126]AEO70775.1 hypothetical protein THITE_127241 [Thermothielavioides terrestris NRRL 8126]
MSPPLPSPSFAQRRIGMMICAVLHLPFSFLLYVHTAGYLQSHTQASPLLPRFEVGCNGRTRTKRTQISISCLNGGESKG